MARLSIDRAGWRRRARTAAIVLVMLIIAIGVVGFFVAPGIVKSVAEKQIAEQTGRRATIGALKINPYALSATVSDFRLYQPDGTTVAVQVDELYANVSSASLLRRALVLDELRIRRPLLSVARLEPQRFDFSDVVDKLMAKPESDEPARFSLNNITLEDGRIAFDDHVASRKHVIEHVTLGLPFVSNLPYATDVFVTPKFAADVNGSHIGLDGRAQPFSKDREATIEFDVADLDVPSYMAFLPVPLRFRITSAKLSTHLAIAFRAAGKGADGVEAPQSLALSGHVDVADLQIVDDASREVVAVKRIEVDADKVDPLRSVIELKRLAVTEPRITAIRRADDSIDLVALFAPPPQRSPPAAPAKAGTTSVSIASAVVRNGRVTLTDEMLATPTTTTFDALDVTLDRVASQGNAPTDFAFSVRTPNDATIEAKGNAVVAQRKVDGTFRMRHFQPGAFANYVAGFLAARIGDGSIDADAHYRIDASAPAIAGRIDGISARVTKLRSQLPNEKTPFAAAEAITLEGGAYDFPTHAFSADALTVTAPVFVVSRDAKGRTNLQAVLIEKAPGTAAVPVVVVKPADATPFTALVKTFVVERGDVTLEDNAQATPVRVHATPLNLKVENIGTSLGTIVPFSIDAGIDGGTKTRGKLSVQGKLTVSPLSLDANVVASDVSVGSLGAYGGDRLNIVLDSADLNARGAVRVQSSTGKLGPNEPATSISYRGSLGITRMRAVDRVTSEEFVRWKTLAIPDVDFRMPAKNAPFAVTLASMTLDDFYTRVIVNTTGRLNLQDVVATPGQTESVTTPNAVARPAVTPGKVDAPPTASAGPKAQIQVKGVKLTNGRVGITDNFVKPNYSANLTNLAGEISAISSDDPKPADVRLDGKIDGDGALTVSGRVDPFAFTRFTDIAAEAKDIELTRLTPYAVKYAGYSIARGKLSTTVKYHIENGKLDAQNRLFLDQLTFGDKVDSPSATRLPVLLAVSLLKNSRGEIDISLPVSGSLSDPEFSVGGVIVRVLVNLLTRAVAAPFSLIAASLGGGGSGADELGYVQFRPGVSDMTPEGKAKVETLAKALADRPALKLDIIGRYDPASDADGIKRDHLLDRLKDLKAKELSKGSDRVGRNDVTIEPAEYAAYLAKVYDDTKLPDKPRNVVGIAKSVPVEDMEQLLLANMKLEPDDPRWLAEARADVVRHFIEDTGKVSPSRVFLVSPKLDASGIDDKGAPTRVDFALR